MIPKEQMRTDALVAKLGEINDERLDPFLYCKQEVQVKPQTEFSNSCPSGLINVVVEKTARILFLLPKSVIWNLATSWVFSLLPVK